jgi:hypothetical protein
MPLVDEAMAGFRLIEDEFLRILIQHCARAAVTMREGISRLAGSEGHPAVFRLPERNKEDEENNLAWQTFPEPSALNAVERASTQADPLEGLRSVSTRQAILSPAQRYANSRAAAVIATALEAGGGNEFNEVVNRIVREDQGITPLVSGLTNLSLVLVNMLSQSLGSTPQELLGSLGDDDSS